jgi:hypothetical protein
VRARFLRAESHSCLQVALKIGPSRHQILSMGFKAADHQCAFRPRSDKSANFLALTPRLRLARPEPDDSDTHAQSLGNCEAKLVPCSNTISPIQD